MAIAGKVAPTYEGDWSADKSYQQHTYVRYNGDAYIAMKASVGIEPTNEEYWFLALKNVSQAQLDALNNRIDQIQTTSSGTLSQAGWYRVAKYDVQSHTNGGSGNGCIIHISNFYSNNNSESHTIQLRSTYGNQEFDSLGSKSSYVTRLFSKIRYTHDANKAYIEVYYAINSSNPAYFKVNSGDILGYWQAITPVLTSETVEGVTITCTYDIPANASPVTDLDLAQVDGSTYLTEPILEKALTLKQGVYNFKLSGDSYTGNDLPNQQYVWGMATIYVFDSRYIVVKLHGYNELPMVYNRYASGMWKGWKTYATTTDLANYVSENALTKTMTTYSATTLDELKAAYQSMFDNTGHAKISQAKINHPVIWDILPSYTFYVETFNWMNLYGWQKAFTYDSQCEYYRYMDNGTWSEWQNYATTSYCDSKLDTALTTLHANRGMYSSTVIDLTDTTIYSEDTWYPCVGRPSPTESLFRYNCYTKLGYSGVPSWATHTQGFTCNLDMLIRGSGWGITDAQSIQLDNSFKYSDENPIGYGQISTNSQPVFYLRGGGKYYIQSEHAATWTVYTDVYEYGGQIAQPQTTYPGVVFSRAVIDADFAGYLKAIGGYVGYLNFDYSGSLYNQIRMHMLNDNLEIGDPNGKRLKFDFSSCGTPSNVLHSGNFSDYALPLDGSKAMTGNLSISNTNGSMALMTSTSGIGLMDKSTTKWILRKFGGKHYVNESDEILTKGNSVAVAVTASAPSDTSALWYDTVNKVLKYYVDGAWQQ